MTWPRAIAVLGAALLWAAGPPARSEVAPPEAADTLDSLMFTGEEIESINEALHGPVKAAPVGVPRIIEQPVGGPAAVHLSAIVYFNPNSWAIWINGARVTPDRRLRDIEVLSVERESVRLKVTAASNRPAVTVRLRPNQSYIARTAEVIEGAPRGPIARRAVSGQ